MNTACRFSGLGSLQRDLRDLDWVFHGPEKRLPVLGDQKWPDACFPATAARPALLQYEIDTYLVDLAHQYGEHDAALAYRACGEAITMLQALASDLRDVPVMQAELTLRKKHGFQVDWLDPAAVLADFGIRSKGAILSQLAARVDPYRLAYRVLMRLEKRGSGIFDRTQIDRIEPTSRGITMHTNEGIKLRAAHVVMAAGYESQNWLEQRVARNRSTYAFITDPLDAPTVGRFADTMAWESARPYLYMRGTADGRLLVGGEDDDKDIPARRDVQVDRKARKLAQKVHAAIPRLQPIPSFAWAGTFAETADGLPLFGPHAQYGSRLHFAMAYGGNGITYSMIGAGLLRALIERRKHPLASLFSFQRLQR